MSKLDQTGKKILRKQRIHEYKYERDFIGRIKNDNLRAKENTSNIGQPFFCHTSVQGDEISDNYELMEFLENDKKFIFEFKRGKRQTNELVLHIFHKVDCLTMSPDYFFKLRGYLSYYTREFFCSFEGLGFTSIDYINERYEPYF